MGRQRERAHGRMDKWVGSWEGADEEKKQWQTLLHLVFDRQVKGHSLPVTKQSMCAEE